MKYKIYKPIIFLILLLLTIIFGLLAYKLPEQWDLFLNISTTFFGILVTVFLVDWLIGIAEYKKWSAIREKLIRNLGTALLRLIFHLQKNGDIPTISAEDLILTYGQLNEPNRSDLVTKTCDEDEIFKKKNLSPNPNHRAIYNLINDELKNCMEMATEIVQAQNYGIKPETEYLVHDFLGIAKNFSKSLTQISDSISNKNVTHGKTYKDSWVHVQNNYYNLVHVSISLFLELVKSGFKIIHDES